MKYIDHLTNFATASLAAGLGPNEITLYMRLFWKANELFWPEYIEMSLADLRNITGIKSHNTIIKAREVLERFGFIKIQSSQNRKTRYCITESKVWQKITSQNLASQKMTNHSSNIDYQLSQKMTNHSSNIDYHTPCEAPNDRRSSGLQDYKTNKTYKTIISGSENNSKKSSDLPMVVEAFTQKIAPSISPIAYEKLADDVEKYGASRVIKAIDRAEQDNKLSLGWVEYLLKNNLEGGK